MSDALRELMEAVWSGNLGAVMRLTEGGAVDVNARDEHGETPLLSAARLTGDRRGVINLLLSAGADPNLTEPQHGRTALHVLIDKGHVEAAKVLLESGADVNAKDNSGLTPLDLANQTGRAAAARVLQEFLDRNKRRDLRHVSQSDVVMCVAISADGRKAVCGLRGRIALWDIETETLEKEWSAHGDDLLKALWLSSDGKLLLSGAGRGRTAQVQFWELPGARAMRTVKPLDTEKQARSIAASEEADRALCTFDESYLCELSTGEIVKEFRKGVGHYARFMSLSRDATVMMRDREIWDCTEGTEIERLSCDPSAGFLGPNAEFAITGDEEGTIEFWRLPDGKSIRQLEAHRKRIRALAISGNGRFLLSSAEDARLWDVDTGECLAVEKFDAPPDSVGLSHDGQVAVMNYRTNLIIWRTT